MYDYGFHFSLLIKIIYLPLSYMIRIIICSLASKFKFLYVQGNFFSPNMIDDKNIKKKDEGNKKVGN